jgi:hypothetical protein
LTQAKLLPKDWALKLKEFIFESLEKWAKEYPQYRAFKIAHQQILDSHGGIRITNVQEIDQVFSFLKRKFQRV